MKRKLVIADLAFLDILWWGGFSGHLVYCHLYFLNFEIKKKSTSGWEDHVASERMSVGRLENEGKVHSKCKSRGRK